MSNPLFKAAEDVKALNRMFSAVQSVATAIEELGSIEQAKNEAEARHAKLNGQVAELSQAIRSSQEEFDAIQAKQESALNDLAKIQNEAQENARAIVDAAQEKANEIVKAAYDQASVVDEDTTKQLDVLQDVVKAIEEKKAELAEVAQKIEDTKAAFRDLVK